MDIFGGYGEIVDIFGGHHTSELSFFWGGGGGGRGSFIYISGFLRSMYRIEIFWGVAKFQIIFGYA